jgi:hypothetical protein
LPVRRSRWRLPQSRDRGLQGSTHCGYCVHGSHLLPMDHDRRTVTCRRRGVQSASCRLPCRCRTRPHRAKRAVVSGFDTFTLAGDQLVQYVEYSGCQWRGWRGGAGTCCPADHQIAVELRCPVQGAGQLGTAERVRQRVLKPPDQGGILGGAAESLPSATGDRDDPIADQIGDAMHQQHPALQKRASQPRQQGPRLAVSSGNVVDRRLICSRSAQISSRRPGWATTLRSTSESGVTSPRAADPCTNAPSTSSSWCTHTLARSTISLTCSTVVTALLARCVCGLVSRFSGTWTPPSWTCGSWCRFRGDTPSRGRLRDDSDQAAC